MQAKPFSLSASAIVQASFSAGLLNFDTSSSHGWLDLVATLMKSAARSSGETDST